MAGGSYPESYHLDQTIMNIRLAERDLKTKYGTFREVLYYDGQKESIALVLGKVEGGTDVLCRVHSACISGHVFNSVECDCREQFEAAQREIEKAGRGVIIWLDQEGKGNGHLALMLSIEHKKAGETQSEAYKMAGYKADARSYRPAAEILADLKIESVIMLTGNHGKAEELRNESVIVSGTKNTT
jgi:GTP cyclohydrolase II/3,4-dihydroxy 2-butanone 4-phosphate synthase/GTP cyclohydrolase II